MPQHCEFKYQVALRVSVAGASRIFGDVRVRDKDTKGWVFCSRHVCKIHAVAARGTLDSRVKRNQLKTQSRRDSPDCDVHFDHGRDCRWKILFQMDAERDNTIQKGWNSQREGPVGRYMRTKARKDILSRWISVDSNTGQTWGFPSFCLFRCTWVLCVFLFSIPGTPSRLAILSGHPSLSPRAAGVHPGSALNLVSRMSPCEGL